MSTRFKNPMVWFWGLVSAVVGGAATAATSWLGMAGAKAAGMDVPSLNWNAVGVICLSGGATAAFAYLQKSPIPQIVEEETAIVSIADVNAILKKPGNES